MDDIEHPDHSVINADHLWRNFGDRTVLRDVNLHVAAGEIHALLGPNGAGKTTLLRILTGLVEPSRGSISIAGVVPSPGRGGATPLGLVPSSDRSFYLRISGLENLMFFARLHGFGRQDALEKAAYALALVDLRDAAHRRVYEYSHGMLKRLAVARALLTEPKALLVDEATHDLDPAAAENVRELVRGVASRGTAVIWTTQRIEEIRGLASRVSVLAAGEIRFTGTVDQLAARSPAPTYVVTVRNGGATGPQLLKLVKAAVDRRAAVSPAEAEGLFRLALPPDAILGDVLSALTASDLAVLGCREERPKIEDAFLRVAAEEVS